MEEGWRCQDCVTMPEGGDLTERYLYEEQVETAWGGGRVRRLRPVNFDSNGQETGTIDLMLVRKHSITK